MRRRIPALAAIVFAFSTALSAQAADLQVATVQGMSTASMPGAAALSLPTPPKDEPWLNKRERIIEEMQARAAHCATLNGYVDERNAKDNTPEQVRVTLYQMADGYDCFGAGTRTADASAGPLRHRVPLVIHQRARR